MLAAACHVNIIAVHGKAAAVPRVVRSVGIFQIQRFRLCFFTLGFFHEVHGRSAFIVHVAAKKEHIFARVVRDALRDESVGDTGNFKRLFACLIIPAYGKLKVPDHRPEKHDNRDCRDTERDDKFLPRLLLCFGFYRHFRTSFALVFCGRCRRKFIAE